MFDVYQISDHAYEVAMEQFWDCPEAMLEDWPDDLFEE